MNFAILHQKFIQLLMILLLKCVPVLDVSYLIQKTENESWLCAKSYYTLVHVHAEDLSLLKYLGSDDRIIHHLIIIIIIRVVLQTVEAGVMAGLSQVISLSKK